MRSKTDRLTVANQGLPVQGYGYIDWDDQGLLYSLVGDVDIAKLLQIADSLQATQLSTNLRRHYGNYHVSPT